MTPNEAATALADIHRNDSRLAERAHWPFHRHAMFGLVEGLLVAGIAQPLPLAAAMTAVSLSLLAVCIIEDRRRNGMLITGWRPKATRLLMVLLVLFLGAMVVASALVRGDGQSAQPLGYLIGAVTFLVCTLASLRWEKIYRAQLARGAEW